MTGPFYLENVVVDEFLIREFVRNPDLAGPLQNVLPMLNRVSKTLRTFGDWLMTNDAVGSICKWAPILCSFISGAIGTIYNRPGGGDMRSCHGDGRTFGGVQSDVTRKH